MILSFDDAVLIQKALHRMATSINDVLAAPKKTFDNKPIPPARILLAPLKPTEASRLIEIVSQLGTLINDHKKAAKDDLMEMGEQGYLEGDGILRMSEKEFRVFVQGTIGTEYAGTYPNVHKAKEVWFTTKQSKGMPANEVEVYVWQKFRDAWGNSKWATAIWAELGEEADVFFNADTHHSQISDGTGHGDSVIMDGDPEGFPGSDYD